MHKSIVVQLDTGNMERIEFLARTDQKNLKFHIDFLVKQHFQLREDELTQRRSRLRDLLEFENLQYDEELVLLLLAQLEENSRKRFDWLKTMRIESEKAEEDFLKLKQLQRELENCEEMRHLQSKQLLVETKQAQLYQIEEKKALRLREKQIADMWWKALMLLDEEKEKQHIFENKLRQVIAHAMQEKNEQQFEEMQQRQKMETKELQLELQLDNEGAIKIDKDYKEQQRTYERRKKLRHGDVLQQQMRENLQAAELQQAMLRQQEIQEQQGVTFAMLRELDVQEKERVKNRAWHKNYLEHCQQERDSIQERFKALDAQLIGRECILYQQNKKPYGKAMR